MRTIPAGIFAGLHDQETVMEAAKKFLNENPNEKVTLSHEASEMLGHVSSALPNMVTNKISDHNEKFGSEVVY
jgi:hypothetical protein